jgi:hypothetical protein
VVENTSQTPFLLLFTAKIHHLQSSTISPHFCIVMDTIWTPRPMQFPKLTTGLKSVIKDNSNICFGATGIAIELAR